MNVLDQIVHGIHETKYQYAIRHAVDNVRVVILISLADYGNMMNDMRTYLYECDSSSKKKEIRVYGCLVLRTSDLEQGDIRFVVDLPK